MNWTDITIIIDSKDIDNVTAIAHMVVPGGLYIEDYSTMDDDLKLFGPIEIIDNELLNKERNVAKVHMYISPDENPNEAISFLTERLMPLGIKYKMESAGVNEEDWANNWKKYFKPTCIGKKLIIIPSWEQSYPENDRIRVIIDPGMAFGSGQHETTRLCMELIEKYIEKDDKMLDVGTGSGILGITGLLLGANSVMGVDIDPLAVRTSKENALINGVSDRFNSLCGDLANNITGEFDIISANIVADVIISLLPDGYKKLKK